MRSAGTDELGAAGVNTVDLRDAGACTSGRARASSRFGASPAALLATARAGGSDPRRRGDAGPRAATIRSMLRKPTAIGRGASWSALTTTRGLTSARLGGGFLYDYTAYGQDEESQDADDAVCEG